MIKVQFNRRISTKGYVAGTFTNDVKSGLAVFNTERNWEDPIEFSNIITFYQYLTENLKAFRFGMKIKSNAKKDALNEIWAIALDLDLKEDKDKGIIGCSIERTKKFAADFNHIFYLSPSGRIDDDTSPHRLILAFNEPQNIEKAEQYAKYVSMLLQGKSICFDATRFWFPPLEHTLHLSTCNIGKGLEELNITSIPSTQKAYPKKEYKISNDIKQSTEESFLTKINRKLTNKALEIGFNEFLVKLNINDVIFTESKRLPENGTIPGEATARYEVKPIGSNCKDRVTANIVDGILYFFDRRDGTAGFSGSFLKFLLLSTGESNVTFANQLDYAKEILETFEIEYPITDKKKKLEASRLWYEFLNDNKDNLIFIKNSQKYGFFNGRYWELYNPEEIIDTIFINWAIAHYGIITATLIGAIKNNIKNVTFDLIKSFKIQPNDRHLFGFQDGLFNTETKEFLPFDNQYYIWSLSEFYFQDCDLDKGKIVFDKFRQLVDKIIVGDAIKKANFLDGFSLLTLDKLWKTQSMMWLYGEGGAGKSTFANWIRDMLGSSESNGKVADLRASELFNSPHSLQKVIAGTVINLSEFCFPTSTDAAFMKDLIASGATENSTKMRHGCAIPINEKYKVPYTAFWVGSIIATSQERPNKDCLLDSGWTRRMNFFSCQKIKETTTLFKEIDESLNQLFFYILHFDIEELVIRYNDNFRNPSPVDQQQMELDISPVASFLNDNCGIIETQEDVPIKVLYREFNNYKQDYGCNYTLSMANFEKYLSRYLSKFYNLSIYVNDKNQKVSRLSLKSLPITTSNGGFSYQC